MLLIYVTFIQATKSMSMSAGLFKPIFMRAICMATFGTKGIWNLDFGLFWQCLSSEYYGIITVTFHSSHFLQFKNSCNVSDHDHATLKHDQSVPDRLISRQAKAYRNILGPGVVCIQFASGGS